MGTYTPANQTCPPSVISHQNIAYHRARQHYKSSPPHCVISAPKHHAIKKLRTS